MFNRSHILTLAAAIVLAGLAVAQPQPGAGSQTPDGRGGTPTGPRGRTARQYPWQSRRRSAGSADGSLYDGQGFRQERGGIERDWRCNSATSPRTRHPATL